MRGKVPYSEAELTLLRSYVAAIREGRTTVYRVARDLTSRSGALAHRNCQNAEKRLHRMVREAQGAPA